MSTTALRRPKWREGKGGTNALPLRHGAHLSRAKFERRWDATTGLARAELIEGREWLGLQDPLAGDARRVLKVSAKRLKKAGHTAFVRRLK